MAAAATKPEVAEENILPASLKTTHPTTGLPGYPAVDWPRPAGTVVGAPAAGIIGRTGPTGGTGDPKVYGQRLYLHTTKGESIFLTHFDTLLVKSGERVERGTPLGTVADFGTADHIHEAIRSSQPVGSTITLKDERPGFFREVGSGIISVPSDALNAVTGGAKGAANVAQTVYGGAKSTGEAIAWLFDTRNILRIGEVVAGGLLVVFGILMAGHAAGGIGVGSNAGSAAARDMSAIGGAGKARAKLAVKRAAV